MFILSKYSIDHSIYENNLCGHVNKEILQRILTFWPSKYVFAEATDNL